MSFFVFNIATLDSNPSTQPCQESGHGCWATRSSVCLFARIAHLFACSTLLDLFHWAHSLAHTVALWNMTGYQLFNSNFKDKFYNICPTDGLTTQTHIMSLTQMLFSHVFSIPKSIFETNFHSDCARTLQFLWVNCNAFDIAVHQTSLCPHICIDWLEILTAY